MNPKYRGARATALVIVVLTAVMPGPYALAAADGDNSIHSGHNSAGTQDDFYSPPPELVDGPHGSLIRARRLTGTPAFAGADNWLVLYRSRTPQGQPVAVSGTVAIPKGPAPRGGWPVLSWTHGTTGVADICAPSHDSASGPAHDYLGLMDQTLAQWVGRGYAVVQTDYQGLGTAGVHSYLIGVAEARAAADIVRATRELSEKVSNDWVVMGHSQGGQAALFGAEQRQSWTPELTLRGAVAIAPPSQTSVSFPAARSFPFDGAAFFAPIIRGVETATELRTQEILTPRAFALLPQADDRCIKQLGEPDSWAGMKTSDIFRPGADMSDFDKVVRENDTARLSPRVPVLLVQGGKDEKVQHYWTELLYGQLKAKGTEVDYRFYPDADHRSAVADSYQDVSTWVGMAFQR